MPANDNYPRAPSRKDDADTEPRMETALDMALREARREVSGSGPYGRNGSANQKTPPPRASESGATPQEVVTGLEDNTTPSELEIAPATAAPTTGSYREGAAEADKREPLVLEAVLLQIPGFDALAMYRLGAAGLNRFATLSLCTAEDIVSETGVDLPTARAVVAEVERWKGGLGSPPQGGRRRRRPGAPSNPCWSSWKPFTQLWNGPPRGGPRSSCRPGGASGKSGNAPIWRSRLRWRR